MKISANRRIYQSYNSQSSLDTASESPVIVLDSQSQKRFNNLIAPSACPSRPVLKKNRLLNNSSALHGSNLAQQHPERVPVKVQSHVRFQSSTNIELPINNFLELPAHPGMNKSQKSKYPVLSAAPFDYFLDSSAEESQQYSENLGDISNAPSMVCSKALSSSKPLDESILSDSDDEFNVWDNSSANEIGIDIQGEENKVPMEFIELFYVRSQLYQEDKVPKPAVLEEVQVISKMCNKPMSMLKSSNLVDNIEKNYHLSIRKNAKQVSQLNFNAQKNENSHFSSQQQLPKHTPKLFRISSVHPFQSPNNNNGMTSSCQFQSKIAPFQNSSQKEIDLPLNMSQYPQSLNKSNNASRNLFRFASNDAISMAPTNQINLASSNVKAREHNVALSQTPQVRGKKSSIKANNINLNTPSKYSVSKIAIDRMMRVTSQATIQANKKIFSRGHFEEDGLRA